MKGPQMVKAGIKQTVIEIMTGFVQDEIMTHEQYFNHLTEMETGTFDYAPYMSDLEEICKEIFS